MRKTICLVLSMLLLLGIGTTAFAENKVDVFGTVNEQTYRNEYFGIQFQGNEKWYLFDAEDTARMMGYVVETFFTDEDLAKRLSESGAVYDLMAMKTDGSGDSVNVVLQDIGALYGTVLKMETVMSLMEAQLKQTLASAGYKNLSIKQEKAVFAGEERPSYMIEGTISGIMLYERAVLIRQGNYLSVITAASTKKDRLDKELLAQFQPIDGRADNVESPSGLPGNIPFAEAKGFRFTDSDDDITVPTDYILADGLTCICSNGNLDFEGITCTEPDVDGYVTVTIHYSVWGVDTISGPKDFEKNFGEYDNGYGMPYTREYNDVTFVDYYTGRILSPAYGWETEIGQKTDIEYESNMWQIDLHESGENNSLNGWVNGAKAWLMQWHVNFETIIRMPKDYDGLLFGMNTKTLHIGDYGDVWEGNSNEWVFVRISDMLD